MKNILKNNNVIVACDFSDAESLYAFLEKFGELRPYLKIGMELFYAEGPAIVKRLKEKGFPIFLDLKLHDIPNTVKKAMAVLARLDVDMCNLHAAGTSRMMKAAIEGLTRPDGTRPILLAVTQLTSTDRPTMNAELLIDGEIEDVVAKYAKNAQESGLDGVVCSPLEVPIVKEKCGKSFLTVTPGVRLADSALNDQKRVTTPARARELGSDFIVVGRPITAAENPYEAYLRCLKEFNENE